MLARRHERFFTIGGLQQFVTVHAEPGYEDIAICFVVVYDQDARRTVHGYALEQRYGRNSRILASS